LRLPVGVDEAGRGSLAGPVVAASFPLLHLPKIFITDSKKIKEDEREEIFNYLLKERSPFGVGVVSNEFIDREGILSATFEAMKLSILPFLYKKELDVKTYKMISLDELLQEAVKSYKNYSAFFPERIFISNILIVVDGNSIFTESIPLVSMIKGDEKVSLISFASVVAKVVRDRIMRILSKDFKDYGWDRNKGYGTREHFDAIEKYGLSMYHRRSFLDKR